MSEDIYPEIVRAYFQASLLVQEIFYNQHEDKSLLDICQKVASEWGLNWQKLYERVSCGTLYCQSES